MNGVCEKIFRLTGCEFSGEISVELGDIQGISVDFDGQRACIRAENENALGRAAFLLAKAINEKKTLHTAQSRQIASVGPMLDCSRGAVYTVEAVKKYIDYVHALGMNLFMLYTEDTYEVPEYPYFGHMRGRYTKAELKEIDDYAFSCGVELVPCVQTLAHLEKFLQWPGCGVDKDTETCLMIDDEKSYAFIEAAVRSLRECFRSGRIHVGMDEAWGVGLGHYFDRFGSQDRLEMLKRHLQRVCAICEKYGFAPMMWSDMIFKLSGDGGHYDGDVSGKACGLPKVGLVYWDYYHEKDSEYDERLTAHEKLGGEVIFAGGDWTWTGFLPNTTKTEATSYPAMRQAIRHRVQTVIATLWGDNGAECNYFLALNQLPIFSEFAWMGEGADAAEIKAQGALLSGITDACYEAYGLFGNQSDSGKAIIWGDPLFHLRRQSTPTEELLKRYEKALDILRQGTPCEQNRYAAALFEVLLNKLHLMQDIAAAYENRQMDTLRRLADESIPALIGLYTQAEALHRKMWMNTCKQNGWEVLALRYGAARGRLNDCALTLREYVLGEIDHIAALEENDLPSWRRDWYRWCATPQDDA